MALHDYLAGEVGEDWADGILSRREAIRRLLLLGLSVSSAVALLEACTPAAGTPIPTAAASASQAAASGSGSGGSSGPTSAIKGEAITFPGPTATLRGFFSAAATPRGAVLVVHENRGLNDHIRSVASRLAGDGFTALAIDLLSEEGGSEALAQGDVQAALSKASTERLTGDMKAGLDELARRTPAAKLGAIGFCFGGGMVWALLDAGDPRLAAAIPFYGPAPAAPDFSGGHAAVLGVYAELDARVNASRPTAEAALTAAGLRSPDEGLSRRRPCVLQRHGRPVRRDGGGGGLRGRDRLVREPSLVGRSLARRAATRWLTTRGRADAQRGVVTLNARTICGACSDQSPGPLPRPACYGGSADHVPGQGRRRGRHSGASPRSNSVAGSPGDPPARPRPDPLPRTGRTQIGTRLTRGVLAERTSICSDRTAGSAGSEP